MKKLLSALIISSALLFVGCKGEDGPAGPAGPAGAQGNANVKTELFDIKGSEWSIVSGKLVNKHATTLLSQDIIDHGLIHVYLKGYRTGTPDRVWIELPASGISIYPHLNELEIETTVDLTGQTTPFKLITVAGNLTGTANIDFSNYEEVQQFFGLED